MKTTITNVGLAVASIIFSMNAWSQCAEIVCPSNITAYADSGSCDAVLSYSAPQGFDACQSLSDTIAYSGAIVQWTVPAGITQLTIETRGASGGNGNGSSTYSEGLGAVMIGDFTVTPGQVLNVLVGENNNTGNGGGGGTFVVDAVSGNPLIVAGGGAGASGAIDWAGKHGQITTNGAAGGGGGGLGGTLGNGGASGASFASGAGGGFFTNGADGWTAGSGGQAFVNGGAGANVGFGVGGFGGGGNGSGNQVGGGGGGYSGGGSGSNSTGAANGGGGGSINNGSNPVNTSGVNLGHGLVIFTVNTPAPTTLLAGLGSGGAFPVGTTTETYITTVSPSDTMTCSFTVTVFDTIAPLLDPISNIDNCGPAVSGIAATAMDYCGGEVITYTLSGATTGSGTGDAGANSFNTGVTTVWYYATDASGNVDSMTFDVNVLPLPTVSLPSFSVDTLCDYSSAIALPVGTPAGGIYFGNGVSGTDFDPALAGLGGHAIVYSYTDTNGCEGSAVATIYVDNCASIDGLTQLTGFNVYPNPSNGVFTIDYNGNSASPVNVTVVDVQGRVLIHNTYNTGSVNDQINMKDASKGVYFVELSVGNEKITQKIIKE